MLSALLNTILIDRTAVAVGFYLPAATKLRRRATRERILRRLHYQQARASASK
jgi:hypothetical protein